MGGVGVGEIFNVAQYATGGGGSGAYPAAPGMASGGGAPGTTYGAQQYRAAVNGMAPPHPHPHPPPSHQRIVSPPSSSHALQQQMAFHGGGGAAVSGSDPRGNHGPMQTSSAASTSSHLAARRSPTPGSAPPHDVSLAPPPPRGSSSSSSGAGGSARSHSPLSQSIPVGPMSEPSNGSASMLAGNHSSLVELLDGEQKYTADLEMIVRKVAGAWSRSNLPPPALDAVFRAIEAVFKANRAFGGRLDALDRGDPSPKALGDVLMSWVDDLEVPYAKYAQAVQANFDAMQGVVDNRALVSILAVVSESNPPSPAVLKNAAPSAASASAGASGPGGWTLDTLFLLPYLRLRYYRRLYSRLLAASQPGRSDHRILSNANDRLQALLDEMERNRMRNVLDLRDGSNRPPSSASSSAAAAAATAYGRPPSNASQQSAASSGLPSAYSSQQPHQPAGRWPVDVKQPLGPERDSSVSASTLGTNSQETHVS